jgi:tetratricopeptide (TPR) repeat protein
MLDGRMAARSILLIRQYTTVPLRRGSAYRTRSCAQRIFQQKPLLRQNYQNVCHASTLFGKNQCRASITNSVHQAYTTSQNRLVILIASASAVLLWTLSPPSSPTRTRFDSPNFRDEDQWSRVNHLLRRATFYADKGDYAEVYEATQLALEECDRLGLRIDEPFVLRIYLDSAGALFKQAMHEEALDTLQLIPEMCKEALRDLDEKGIDADEVHQNYLGRSRKIAPDMTLEEYEAYKWGRMSWFKLLVESEMMRAQILSASGNEERSIGVVISVVVAIEQEMGHDYSRAPDFPDPNGALSKVEIFSILELLRGVLMWRGIDRALPFSQRILALMQSTEDERKTCAVVDAMRWLAINLSGAGTDLELREGNRTARVIQLYSEARQWAEQALEIAASIKASGDSGNHPLIGFSEPDEQVLCDANCVAILNLLAGMSLFIDKDEKEGRRLLAEGLSLAKPLGAESQIKNAEGFLKDMDAGTVGSEDTNIRDGELFGYTQRLERERGAKSSGVDNEPEDERR